MLKRIDWKTYFTESINPGLATVFITVLVMVVTGFTAALYSEGEAMLMAARTFTYPIAPYLIFSLIGFAIYHSSRRRSFITAMFNACAVILLVLEVISLLSVSMTAFENVEAMMSQLFEQSFVLSIIVVMIFIASAFSNFGRLRPAKQHDGHDVA